jgi:hypothetical protein
MPACVRGLVASVNGLLVSTGHHTLGELHDA